MLNKIVKHWRKWAVGLVIGTALAAQIDFDGVTTLKNYEHGQGAFIIENGEKYEIDGFDLRGGRVENFGDLLIKGNFYWRKNAEFKNKGIIRFAPDTIIHVEKKDRTIIIPASYGPMYSSTGVVLFGTGVLITSTGSRIEQYVPSLGYVIIQ